MFRRLTLSPGASRVRKVARVAEQRLAVAERAGDDVAGLTCAMRPDGSSSWL